MKQKINVGYRTQAFSALLLFLFLAALQPANGYAEDNGRELMEKAKLEIFDRKWDAALEKLEVIVKKHSNSVFYPRALFYKGKCLKEKKQYKEAVRIYRDYLRVSGDDAFAEDATIDIIDLSFSLYEQGGASHLKDVTSFLTDDNPAVQYFAAFKLSYARDKKVAMQAAPILKKIIRSGDDQELSDRAKVALMRINPALLENISKVKNNDFVMFSISIKDKKTGQSSLSISFPFSLAKLALESLPEDEKKALGMQGYNIDSILKILENSSEIIKLETEDSIIRIWVK